ncbi:MAG: VWA domain-containing protein [Marinicellaceae bacterium]
MLIDYFYKLKKAQIPVSIQELLTLLDAMQKDIAFGSMDEFYQLSKMCLVKDEKYFDRFDQAFGEYYEGLKAREDLTQAVIPENWLETEFFKNLSDEEKAKIESLGGLDKIMETLKKRLEEQKKKHAGGNKWIGTGGTSPFGHGGYNPEGVRIGGESVHKRAVKVWEKRQYKNLDDNCELGTRNIKVALRKLRKFARTGVADELDLDDTIKSTAKDAGLLNIKLVPERHNAVKLLIFFDVGGSMDRHVRTCEQLFSAVKIEFKHLEYFYFHNCVYENLWKDNTRRYDQYLNTTDIINTFGNDYHVIFVGDAAMSPYEVAYENGSVEHNNAEAGSVWLSRIKDKWSKTIWLNPVQEEYWKYTQSTQMIKELFEDKMYPLTVSGLTDGIKFLSR